MRILTQEIKEQIVDYLIFYINRYFVENKKSTGGYGHDLNSNFLWKIKDSSKEVLLAHEILHTFPAVLNYFKGDYKVLLDWLEKCKIKSENPYNSSYYFQWLESDRDLIYFIFCSLKTFDKFIKEHES